MEHPIKNLVLVLGDQLDESAPLLASLDPRCDLVWMAEVMEESTHVWCSKQRAVLFLSAMRHFAQTLQGKGLAVSYRQIDDPGNRQSIASELAQAIRIHKPDQVAMTAPGDWRVLALIRSTCQSLGVPLQIHEDSHFFSTVADFRAHAKGRKQLRLEYWYRECRQRHGVLMDGDAPAGGKWNFDHENRAAFPKSGPPERPPPLRFAPDEVTCRVIEWANSALASHPGNVAPSAQGFGWAVTRQEALALLSDFIAHRLPQFGLYQDAMWTDEPWLFHSHIASALNLKLLSAREVVSAVEQAWRGGNVPIESAEGFIRQVLGWREYVRGIYWTQMPDYAESNALAAEHPLPSFFWTGETEMNCLSQAISQTLETGYAHHIQRLMVTGLYTLMFGVNPRQVHAWYLSVYVDAVEWVELPNVMGMSQYADGGLMASKPYVATGKYISRMSNYCSSCRFKPDESVGERACPFTTLYWDFLLRHQAVLRGNQRMVMQLKNLDRLSEERRAEIQAQADQHRKASLSLSYSSH
jgi:deoxyribodipyrimidine photolyase-related protein